uniref:Two pore potassium channel protein sup-9 n=1 Tax=Panagrellus redivivus TaxID=6233 RepID=A0A7E4V4Y7_PANRE
MRETNARLAIGFVVIFFYLLIGAIVFVRIEAPAEQILFDEYKIMRYEWEAKLFSAGFSADQVDQLFANIRFAAENGVWQEANVTSDNNWTFGSAFFFAGALLTTVGYGHASPHTSHGKLFAIVYCVVGIPMTLALLSALAQRLRYPSAWLRKQLNVHLGSMFHAIHLQWIHLLVVCLLLFIFAFLIPSLIFVSIEPDWTFIDAIYFCFISLSTIGLGDYQPGDDPKMAFRGFYKFFVTVYLILGLSCMMLFLATLYDIPQCNLTKFFVTKSGLPEDDDPDDDDNIAQRPPAEFRPIPMQNGGPKYTRYNGDDFTSPQINGSTNHLPFSATNGYYQ